MAKNIGNSLKKMKMGIGVALVSVFGTACENQVNCDGCLSMINKSPSVPAENPVSPVAIQEDTVEHITLLYSSAGGAKAKTCAVTNPTNVTFSTPCSCDGSGACTVGVAGVSNYSGAASFSYTVTVNGKTSDSTTALLTVTAVNDAPVISNVTDKSTNEETALIDVAVTIDDVDSVLTCGESLRAVSSNSTLLPNGNITIGGNAPDCTLAMNPAANQRVRDASKNWIHFL